MSYEAKIPERWHSSGITVARDLCWKFVGVLGRARKEDYPRNENASHRITVYARVHARVRIYEFRGGAILRFVDSSNVQERTI